MSDEGLHPRKYSRLTDRGRRVLDEMLAHWDAFTEKIGRLVRAARGGRK